MREKCTKENLKTRIESMREELNQMVLKDLDKDKVVKISQELDLLINEFLSAKI
ncbi:aspartyl-phosphate phosphatase Spo0E family protein [Tissierella sp.]|uniref:aspartyl-phosphate phosphatase Spo0E family protein n=1 Tax=Tissierella sp. TaxID=41274 RepID=UPI00285F2C57|nr:aspartyl-phosphate phosphatase Spo0E family protein [Tissierella sp.]MDR7857748.1 aspartyl-phosphate phosphatase Spo0E family protein [Tissierella sp.]